MRKEIYVGADLHSRP